MRFCGLPEKELRVIHEQTFACGLHFSECQGMESNYGNQSYYCYHHFSSSTCFSFLFSSRQNALQHGISLKTVWAVTDMIYILCLYFFPDRLYLCLKIVFIYAFFPVQLNFLFSVSQLPFSYISPLACSHGNNL